MNQNYQTRISPQICKVQTDRKLIAVYDQLKCAALTHYAQLHAKGEYKEHDHKANSLIKVTIQDYSNGTGDKNVIAQFNLAPEQIQFILTRITAGFQEFEWSQSKIYGSPDAQGYSTAQQFSISRHTNDSSGRPMKSPWRIQIVNGKGIKVQNQKGGSYMKSGSFLSEKNAFIQLTDMDFYTLLKRTDSYITNWEACMAPALITNGKQAYEKQQQDWQSQSQSQDQSYPQNGQYQGQNPDYSSNGQYPGQSQDYSQNGGYPGQSPDYTPNGKYVPPAPDYMQNNTQNNPYQNQAQGNTYAA
ncbi:hypothetical protein AALC16_15595 [Lachnospiraceae bacterium 29-91]